MLPTPIHPPLPPSVYPPSEDTYLLLDTLSSTTETAFLSARFPPSTPSPLILEPGSGSGTIIAFLAAHARTMLGRSDVICLSSDANPDACGVIGKTVSCTVADTASRGSEGAGKSGCYAGCLRADLLTPLRTGCGDVVVFNPPYVPTTETPGVPCDEEVGGDGAIGRDGYAEESRRAELAYAGGRDGMEVTDRFFVELQRVLSSRGVGYLLLCARNFPEIVVERIRTWEDGRDGLGANFSWGAEIVGSSGKTGGWEKLVVVRIWRERREVRS